MAFAVQSQDIRFAKLNVGDTMPDFNIAHIINYKSTNAKMSDFRGKPILLDFWATWCSSCILLFPEIDALQRKFGDSVQFMLVNTKYTRDDGAKAKKLLDRLKKEKGVDLPSIIGDTILDRLFQHRSIPHYVWIDGNGVVRAITDPKPLNHENITRLLSGEQLDFRVKDLQSFDNTKPFLIGQRATGNILGRVLTGFILDCPEPVMSIDTTNNMIRRLFVNMDIVSLYKEALEQRYLPPNRIVLEVRDPSRFSFPRLSQGTPYSLFQEWMEQHTYCYEIIAKATSVVILRNLMLKDLNQYLELKADMQKRKVKGFELVMMEGSHKNIAPDTEKNIVEDGRLLMKQAPLGEIADAFNWVKDFPAVVCYTNRGRKTNVDLQDIDYRNIDGVRRQLRRQGLDLVEREIEQEMLVISEK